MNFPLPSECRVPWDQVGRDAFAQCSEKLHPYLSAVQKITPCIARVGLDKKKEVAGSCSEVLQALRGIPADQKVLSFEITLKTQSPQETTGYSYRREFSDSSGKKVDTLRKDIVNVFEMYQALSAMSQY